MLVLAQFSCFVKKHSAPILADEGCTAPDGARRSVVPIDDAGRFRPMACGVFVDVLGLSRLECIAPAPTIIFVVTGVVVPAVFLDDLVHDLLVFLLELVVEPRLGALLVLVEGDHDKERLALIVFIRETRNREDGSVLDEIGRLHVRVAHAADAVHPRVEGVAGDVEVAVLFEFTLPPSSIEVIGVDGDPQGLVAPVVDDVLDALGVSVADGHGFLQKGSRVLCKRNACMTPRHDQY